MGELLGQLFTYFSFFIGGSVLLLIAIGVFKDSFLVFPSKNPDLIKCLQLKAFGYCVEIKFFRIRKADSSE